MIIKGKSRGRAKELARHLLRTDHNETVRLFEAKGTVARDVPGALLEMDALGLASRSAKPLYHASISPEKHLPLTDAQVRIAVDTLEKMLGLSNQPRVLVLHQKGGAHHVHVVWSRIDAAQGRAIPDGWNYRHHEQAARELEAAFGHPTVRRGPARAQGRRAPKEYEYRQAERSGVSTAEISAELKALWESAADGKAFQEILAKAGYTLARGDRRVFVVIDRAGNVHSLSRRLGIPSAQLMSRLDGLSLDALPSVAESRTAIRRKPRQAALRLAYRHAAQEMTRHVPEPAVRPRQKPSPTTPSVRPNILSEQIAWINSPMHGAGRRPRRMAALAFARMPSTYHALRAIIVAEFAAKIASAYRHARADELEAILEALRAERMAALRVLEEQTRDTEGTQRRGGMRRRGPARSPHRRFRIRRRFVRRRLHIS